MVLALIGQYQFKNFQVHVKSAVLNRELQEELYVPHTEWFAQEGQEDTVMKLHKSQYGLRQAARAWNGVLCKRKTTLGFFKSYHDESLYTRLDNNGSRAIIVAYVDNMLIVGEQEEQVRSITTQIKKHVELRVEQSVTKFLGMYVDYNGGATD